ncbi:MAG: hypothetical protein M1155_00025 [Patescibacteria group bacterium]|nr:hypothetical protein [Patescibacteria group bacterium]
MFKKFLLPASMLAGTIIGAGMFSLPFVFKRAGLPLSFLILFLFSLIYVFVYFLYSDVILRTGSEHRLLGYARIYFGRVGFWSAIVIGLLQLFFILTVYLILAPSFSQLIFGGSYGYNFLFFWMIGSVLLLLGTKKIAGVEFFIVTGILLIIVLVFFSGLAKIGSYGFYGIGSQNNVLTVIGPALFSLSGVLFIPEIITYFKKSDISLRFLKRSLLLGSFMPAIAYSAFVLGIIGISSIVSEDAIGGLMGNVPFWTTAVLGVLGFFSLLSSYALTGLNIRHTLEYDLSVKRAMAEILIIFIPPAIYFLGFKDFVNTVSFVGSMFIPMEIIFLILIWWRMDKLMPENEYFDRRIIKAGSPLLFIGFSAFLIYLFVR